MPVKITLQLQCIQPDHFIMYWFKYTQKLNFQAINRFILSEDSH